MEKLVSMVASKNGLDYWDITIGDRLYKNVAGNNVIKRIGNNKAFKDRATEGKFNRMAGRVPGQIYLKAILDEVKKDTMKKPAQWKWYIEQNLKEFRFNQIDSGTLITLNLYDYYKHILMQRDNMDDVYKRETFTIHDYFHIVRYLDRIKKRVENNDTLRRLGSW